MRKLYQIKRRKMYQVYQETYFVKKPVFISTFDFINGINKKENSEEWEVMDVKLIK